MNLRSAFLKLFFLLAGVSNCFADNVELFDSTSIAIDRASDEKIYISSEVIHFNQNKIIVNFDGQLLSVANISADENGLYLSVDQVVTALKRQQETSWTCRWCGRRNTMDDRRCARCGRGWAE